MERQAAPEALLDCLRIETDVAKAHELSRLSCDEWLDVVRESTKHDITPILRQRLQALLRNGDLPPEVSQKLHEGSIASAFRNLRLYHALSELLKALRDEHIPVIVLKGAYLAEAVYGDIALRSMRDIDLMVRKSDLPRVEARMVDLGYSELRKSHVSRDDYATLPHVHPLIDRHGVPVELHWTTETGPFRIDIDGLWERARSTAVAGIEVLVLSPEDLLLHLCLHTAFHHKFGQGLRPVWDILKVIEHHGSEIDWQQVESRSAEWKIRKHVYLTLHLAKELLGAAVPAQALTALKPRDFDSKLAVLATSELLGHQATSPWFARMFGTMSLLDKALVVVHSAFPSRREMARLYDGCESRYWTYFYYPVRWRDLLLKYGLSAWRLARGDQAAMTFVQRGKERAAFMDWLASVD
jgi:putative nucleotidyltransferase-like protein